RLCLFLPHRLPRRGAGTGLLHPAGVLRLPVLGEGLRVSGWRALGAERPPVDKPPAPFTASSPGRITVDRGAWSRSNRRPRSIILGEPPGTGHRDVVTHRIVRATNEFTPDRRGARARRKRPDALAGPVARQRGLGRAGQARGDQAGRRGALGRGPRPD